MEDFGVSSLQELRSKLSPTSLDSGRKVWVGPFLKYYSTAIPSEAAREYSALEIDEVVERIENLDSAGKTSEALEIGKEFYQVGNFKVRMLEEFLRSPVIDKKEDKDFLDNLAESEQLDRDSTEGAAELFVKAMVSSPSRTIRLSANPSFETPKYQRNLEEEILTEDILADTIKCLGGEVKETSGAYSVGTKILPAFLDIKKGVSNYCRKFKENLALRRDIYELISDGKNQSMDISMEHPVLRVLPVAVVAGVMVGAAVSSVVQKEEVKITDSGNISIEHEVNNSARSGVTQISPYPVSDLKVSGDFVTWVNIYSSYDFQTYYRHKILLNKTYEIDEVDEEVTPSFEQSGSNFVYNSEYSVLNYCNLSNGQKKIIVEPSGNDKAYCEGIFGDGLMFTQRTLGTGDRGHLFYKDINKEEARMMPGDSGSDNGEFFFPGQYYGFVNWTNVLKIYSFPAGKLIYSKGGVNSLFGMSNKFFAYREGGNESVHSLPSGRFLRNINLERTADVCLYKDKILYSKYVNGGEIPALHLLDLNTNVEEIFQINNCADQVSMSGERIAFSGDDGVFITSRSNFNTVIDTAPEQIDLKIAHITDLHVTPKNEKYILNKLNKIVEEDVDFAIITGDIVNNRKTENFDAAKRVLHKDASGNFYLDSLQKIPAYVIEGNHDDYDYIHINIPGVWQSDVLIPYSGGDFSDWTSQMAPTDLNGIDFAKTISGKVTLIGLNSGADGYPISGGSVANDLYAAPWSEGFKDGQVDAVESALIASNAPVKIVAMYHPTNFKLPNGEIWSGPTQNREAFNSLLEEHNCIELAGHVHDNAKEYPSEINGAYYVETADLNNLAACRIITVDKENKVTISPQKFLEDRLIAKSDCPVIMTAEVGGTTVDETGDIYAANYQITKLGENNYSTTISIRNSDNPPVKLKCTAIADGEMKLEVITNSLYRGDFDGQFTAQVSVKKGQVLLTDLEDKTVQFDENGDGVYDKTIDVRDGTLEASDLELRYHKPASTPAEDVKDIKPEASDSSRNKLFCFMGVSAVAAAAVLYNFIKNREKRTPPTPVSLPQSPPTYINNLPPAPIQATDPLLADLPILKPIEEPAQNSYIWRKVGP